MFLFIWGQKSSNWEHFFATCEIILQKVGTEFLSTVTHAFNQVCDCLALNYKSLKLFSICWFWKQPKLPHLMLSLMPHIYLHYRQPMHPSTDPSLLESTTVRVLRFLHTENSNVFTACFSLYPMLLLLINRVFLSRYCAFGTYLLPILLSSNYPSTK